MISVLIPWRNCPYLWHTVDSLLKGVDREEIEILIYDDFSHTPLQVDKEKYPMVRTLRGGTHRGVGTGFDILNTFARGEYLVLMGSDIIVEDERWVDFVKNYSKVFPEGIGCSTCLTLNPSHIDINNPADNKVRYGCNLKPLLVTDDRADMFAGEWIYDEPETSEISCLMGGLYFCKKEWFDKIGGWDFQHRAWGSLEAWLSIKSYLCGGYLYNVLGFKSGHVWSKFDHAPNGRADYRWYNAFFIAYTMMPEDPAKLLIDKCYSLRIDKGLSTYPFNLGKKLIKQNWDKVLEVREKNNKRFTRDWDWLVNKFNIEI